MAKQPNKPVSARRHIPAPERERFLNRLLLIGTVAIVAIVVAIVAWIYIADAYIYPNQTVAVVEGQEINGSEFIQRARYNRQQLINVFNQTYNEYLQMQQIFGNDPTFTQTYQGSLLQIQAQLDPEASGQFAIDQIVNERLLTLEAAEMGIAITEADIDAELKNLFFFFPNGTPTPVPFATTLPTSTLNATQFAIVSATPTITATLEPSATATIDETAIALITLTPSMTPTASRTPFPTGTITPTATEYTLEGFEDDLATFYSNYEQFAEIDQQTIRDAVRASLLRDAVLEVITADLERTQEQVWARHILVETEEEAQTVLDRLAAGEDWSALAAELSTDGSAQTGGDLGWFARERMVEPFANAAFGMEVGEISEPVESDFGWHIIQVLGHEDRPLSDQEYQDLKDRKLEEFILELRDKYEWEIFDAWKAMAPDDPSLPGM